MDRAALVVGRPFISSLLGWWVQARRGSEPSDTDVAVTVPSAAVVPRMITVLPAARSARSTSCWAVT